MVFIYIYNIIIVLFYLFFFISFVINSVSFVQEGISNVGFRESLKKIIKNNMGRVKKKSKKKHYRNLHLGGVMIIPSLNYFFFVWVINDAKMH